MRLSPWAIHLSSLLFLGGVSLWVFLRQMDLAGIMPDEAVVGSWAKVILSRDPAPAPNSYFAEIFGVPIPLLFALYRGPWDVYTAVPFVWAIGDPWWALRMHAVFWGVLGVWGTYGLLVVICREWLTSFLGGLAMATFVYFVFCVQSGVTFGISAVAFCSASLGFLILACRKKSYWAWWASCLCCGLSVGFAHQAAAFFIGWCIAVFWMRKELKPLWVSPGFWVFWLSPFLLLIGFLPLLVANWIASWPSVDLLMERLLVGGLGIANTDYFHNLYKRLNQIWILFGRTPWGTKADLWVILFSVALGAHVVAGKSFFRCVETTGRVCFLPLLFILVLLALSPLSLLTLATNHLLFFLPMFLGLLAMMPAWVAPRVSQAMRRIVTLGLLSGVFFNGRQLQTYWHQVAETGCLYDRTALAEELGRWLRPLGVTRVYACSYYAYDALHYALFKESRVEACYDQPWVPWTKTRKRLERWMRARAEGDGYFIFELQPRAGGKSRVLDFVRSAASRYGKKMSLVREFKRWDGKVIFAVYRLVPVRGTREKL